LLSIEAKPYTESNLSARKLSYGASGASFEDEGQCRLHNIERALRCRAGSKARVKGSGMHAPRAQGKAATGLSGTYLLQGILCEERLLREQTKDWERAEGFRLGRRGKSGIRCGVASDNKAAQNQIQKKGSGLLRTLWEEKNGMCQAREGKESVFEEEGLPFEKRRPGLFWNTEGAGNAVGKGGFWARVNAL